MIHIDKITIKTDLRRGSSDTFDVVELWIAGLPFRADLTGEIMERQVHRIASEAGVELLDHRAAQARTAAGIPND